MAKMQHRVRTLGQPSSGTGRREEITVMYWYGNGMSGWGYALMTISMVLFWGAVIAGIVLLVRHVGRSGQQTPPPPSQPASPEQLLAERFARGEIDEEEYRRRLEVLQGTGQAADSTGRPAARKTAQ
jgi:putative membrane protein